jgi:hypothetical protein
MLPKIHKTGIPGRPIVSACGCPTERISAYVDHHLKPLVELTFSYLRDSTHFLNKLSMVDIPPDAILCTVDVSSLYTNIPHTDGLYACKQALDGRDTPEPPSWLLITLLQKVLTLNSFDFDGVVYHQLQGTSMGSKCAPNYANLFMSALETQLLDETPTAKPLIWWRFIDDIFMIWTHSAAELEAFLRFINSHHPTIKFTSEQSQESINFLDVTIYKSNAGTWETKLYSKPTDAHLYLHYSSCHHRSTKVSIPFSQALRAKRICSTEIDFQTTLDNMMTHFLARGYPDHVLRESFSRASGYQRHSLLNPTPKADKTGTLILAKYRHGGYNPSSQLQPFLKILEANTDTKALADDGFITGRRRGPNLRDLLVQSKFLRLVKVKGSHPCGRPCATCPFLGTHTSYQSHANGTTLKIRGSYNCQTSNAVYMIQCKKCHLQYVGQTRNTINTRFRGHTADIRRADQIKPVSKHFTLPDHNINDVTIIVLDQNNWTTSQRLVAEESLITTLQTLQPSGLNIIEG